MAAIVKDTVFWYMRVSRVVISMFKVSWSLGQQFPPKCWCVSSRIHTVTSVNQ